MDDSTTNPARDQSATSTTEQTLAPTQADQATPSWLEPKNDPNQAIEQSDSAHDFALGNINRGFEEKATIEKAQELKLPYVNIGKTPINLDLLRIVNFASADAAHAMPFFKVGKKLRLAVVNPADEETRKLIQKLEADGFEISMHLASASGLADALKIYSEHKPLLEKDIISEVSEANIQAYEKEINALKDITAKLNTVSSEEALNLIDVGVIKTGASDVHYEPEKDNVIVRFRIDGVLHKVFEINHDNFKNLSNQIKYKCKMKLNITNIPQDGRYAFHINERDVDVRVSSLPTQFGETFVCRYLDSKKGFLSFEELGFDERQRKILEKITKISNGMVLVTGPTGSGKTTTLYSMLNVFKSPQNKVITLEDPIEYHVDGISQSQINEKRDYTFANGLRSILRQDPDVVMIGEIRDLETAETSAQAALTGHVLLSTLHTNSAIESIPRLTNMGLPPFMIAPSLSAVIAQRLVRKICDDCKKVIPVSASVKAEIEKALESLHQLRDDVQVEVPAELAETQGCDKCSHTGYKGRLVVSEILMVDFSIKELILNKESSVKIIEAARKQGMITMREDGILKVIAGVTTLEEVYRVTNIVG